MSTTEEEARLKWCPMVQVIPSVIRGTLMYGVNRDISLLVEPNMYDPKTDITRCIAKDCMMWRWDHDVEGIGYCGLAETV